MTSLAGSAAPVRGSTSFDPAAGRAIEEQRARRRQRLHARERWSSPLIGGAFLAVAVPLAVLLPTTRATSLPAIVALVALYAVAFRIEFEIGTGSAVPTQLVLVPMLFVLPLGLVPLAVAAGILAGSTPELARGGPLGRVFPLLVNSWHSLGPVAVLALAGEAAPSWAAWPVYVAALAAQFGFDFASCAARERLALGVRPRTLLGYMSRAWAVDAALAPVGLAAVFAAGAGPLSILLTAPLVGLLAVFARERHARVDHALELGQAYRGTALLLGDVIEADDEYTGSHSRDVVDLVVAVAVELGLDERERRDAEFTALLHDVGKIRIPAEIIGKPGPLTPEERAVMETHTVIGEQLLEQVGGLLGEVGGLVRSCHERWDGGGYPDGLAGEGIPLVARIVCACDAYSAMTSDRPYRKALSVDEAVARLREGAGTQFDPRAVDALIAVATRAT